MRLVALIARAGAVVLLGGVLVGALVDAPPRPVVVQEAIASPVQQAGTSSAEPRPVPRRARAALITLSATGDIVMGSTPNLPPDGGRSFFSGVQADLAADVALGNLEGTLSVGGTSKCGPQSTNCFAFQTPPGYARWLRRAGFTIMSLANNHAYDYGASGLRQTVTALNAVGLRHTGRPGQVTILDVEGTKVAVLGFASYPWASSLTDIPAAKRLVRKASRLADVVVVTMHAGAEGADRQHVARRTETYLGENRGNPMRFSRAVVDAGADLVVGHGPHVLRGMEWYRGRLIAYSLGNFAGYKVFSLGGPLSVSAILRVTLRSDGTFETGTIVPTRLVGEGVPALDPAEAAHGVVRDLSRADFGARAVKVDANGVLARPPAAP
jgi:hypothetical protein